MKIYISSATPQILKALVHHCPDHRFNFMFSFASITKSHVKALQENSSIVSSTMLDSGAYTLNFGKGEKRHIRLLPYMDYLETHQALFDVYFNFDALFFAIGFENNHRNLNLIESCDLYPTPVIHDYKDYYGEVSFYKKSMHPIISLGWSAIKTNPNLIRLTKEFQQAGKQVHLLGRSTYNLLSKSGAECCDSSSWARYAQFGNVVFWRESKIGPDKTELIYCGKRRQPKITFANYQYVKELDAFLWSKARLRAIDLVGEKQYLNRQIANVLYYHKLEEEITKLHTK